MYRTMDKNQSTAKKIWHDYLQCSANPLSWGLDFNSVKVIEDGTAFHVQGMVCGMIKIQQDTTTNRYKITITPDDSMESEVVYHYVFCENIVSLIDVNVKYGISYYDYICLIFGLTQKMAV